MVRAASPELITTKEADRMFRMRWGTARHACIAGCVKCKPVSARGRQTFLIDIHDARRLWGAK